MIPKIKPSVSASIKIPLKAFFALMSSFLSMFFAGVLIVAFGNDQMRNKLYSFLDSLDVYLEWFANLIKKIGTIFHISSFINVDGDLISEVLLVLGVVGFVLSGGAVTAIKIWLKIIDKCFKLKVVNSKIQLLLYIVDFVIAVYSLIIILALAVVWSLYNTIDKINAEINLKADTQVNKVKISDIQNWII